MQTLNQSLRYTATFFGLGLMLSLSGCDEAQDLQDEQAQAPAKNAPGAQNAGPGAPGAKPQDPAPGNPGNPGQAPAGPDILKTEYNPTVQLGGLYTFDQLDIPSHDGITIEALVTEPTAKGKHPLILMPGSWTMNRKEYEVPARQWASQGFVVISYTSRGFHGSGGEIDICGPDTVKDLSALIDWAAANTSADQERVGAMGISYGGGAALLAAAQDPRLDAVVSMSGWTDLRFSNFPNQTGASQSGGFLVSTAEASGRRGEVMQKIDSYIADGKVEEALKLFDKRSPRKFIDEINDNAPAVMISHAWNDGIFPPSQVLDFYNALETPKRLLIQPGSHSSAEGAGLAGLPDTSWKLALEWMRKHVAGQDLVEGAPVMMVSNDNKTLTTAASLEDWEAQMQTLYLGPPQAEGLVHHYGAMTSQGVFGWHFGIEGGRDTVAQSGTLLVSGALNGLIGLPQVMNTTTVDRRYAGIWKSEPIMRPHDIAGTPEIEISIASPDDSVTMVAYLYESLATTASLITYAPMTVRDLDPSTPTSVHFKLEPTQWNIAPGSRLVLVIDTIDKRYQSETSDGQSIEFSSSGQHQARIHIPMRPSF